MLFVKVLITFSLIYFCASKNECEIHKYLAKEAPKYRRGVDKYGVINHVIEYLFLNEYPQNDNNKLIQFLRDTNGVFLGPMMMIERYSSNLLDFQGFNLNLRGENYEPFNVYVDLSFLEHQDCVSTDLGATVWKVKSDYSFCVLIFACGVYRVNQHYEVKQRLIILTDHFNFTLSDYETKIDDHLRSHVAIYCMCDFLEPFYNECETNQNVKVYAFLMFFGFIIGIYLSYEIYWLIMRSKNDQKLFKKREFLN